MSVLAAAAFCIALLVVVNTLHAVFLAYREIPFWDQWRTVSELQQIDEQGLTWRVLFSLHNEHRIVITRLAFLLDHEFFHGRGIFPYWTVIFLQTLNAALIVRIYLSSLQSQREQRVSVLTTVIVSSAVVFGLMLSLVQQESLAWGIQVGFVGVYAFSTVAFWCYANSIATDGRGPSHAWFSGSLAAFLAATFSLSNGILCGPILLLVGFLLAAPLRRQVTIAVLTIGLATFYFHSGSSLARLDLIFQEPLPYLHYVTAFLGNPLRRFGLGYATALGSVGLVSAAIIGWKILSVRHQNIGQLTLFAVILFVLLTAAVIGLTRIHFGVNYALESRYTTPSCIFWATQILYWNSRATKYRSPWILPSALSASFAFLLLVVTGEAASEKTLKQRTQTFDLVTNALLSNISDPKILRRICWDPNLVIKGARYLRERRLAVFSSDKAAWFGRKITQIIPIAKTDSCVGSLNKVELLDTERELSVSGWAYDREANLPVANIVLVNLHDRVSGYASGGYRSSDIPTQFSQFSNSKLGWIGFAKGEGEVRAFAILSSGKACELGKKDMLMP